MKTLVLCAMTTAAIAAMFPSFDVLAVDYRVIAEQNLFDPQRKPWPELESRAAPVAAPGPEEVQVLGVVVVGGVKRAVIKLGGRLRQFAPGGPGGRGNAVLSEGQSVGGYTLEAVEPNQVVLASGGNRFAIRITRSAQRDAGAPAPVASVIQAPTTVEAPPQPGAPPARSPAPGQFPPSAQFPQPPAAMAPAAGAPAAGSATPPTVAGAGQVPVPQAAATAPTSGGMTLLQAIQAAEAARRAGQVQAPPVNPFLPRQ